MACCLLRNERGELIRRLPLLKPLGYQQLPRHYAEELLLVHPQPPRDDKSKVKTLVENLCKQTSLPLCRHAIPLRHAAVYGTFPLALCRVGVDAKDTIQSLDVLETPWELDPPPPPASAVVSVALGSALLGETIFVGQRSLGVLLSVEVCELREQHSASALRNELLFRERARLLLELGKLWQILLFVGLIAWLLIVYRPMGHHLWKKPRTEFSSLVTFYLLSAITVVGFFGFGLLYGKGSHLTMADYWRWFVVHIWVESIFEFFGVP
jgi:hypothetical protein